MTLQAATMYIFVCVQMRNSVLSLSLVTFFYSSPIRPLNKGIFEIITLICSAVRSFGLSNSMHFYQNFRFHKFKFS